MMTKIPCASFSDSMPTYLFQRGVIVIIADACLSVSEKRYSISNS